MLALFKLIFKILPVSGMKKVQLTQKKITHNTKHGGLLTLILLAFFFLVNFTNFIFFVNLLKLSALDMISNLDNFIYYKLYMSTEFELLHFQYSNIYFIPITNFSMLSIDSTVNFFENFFFNISYFFKNDYLYFLFKTSGQFAEDFDLFSDFRVFFIFFLILYFFLFFFNPLFKYFYYYCSLVFFIFFFAVIQLSPYIDSSDIQNYLYFQLKNSFKNRNLYVDSNYFLNSNTLFGLEKFSEVSVPWLVDYEDLGWGLDFDPQDQVLQISERERRFITDELNINHSPHLEDSSNVAGSLKARLLKLEQRVGVYFSVFFRFLNEFFKYYFLFKDKKTYSVESDYVGWSSIVRNFFKKKDFSENTVLGAKHKSASQFFFGNHRKNKDPVKHFLPKLEIKNDFILPKKNNITNENFSNIGSIRDRKQSVYRKLTDSNFSVNTKFSVKSRIPDMSKESNYIFERQLQYERSLDLDFSEFLKNRMSRRFDFYFLNNFGGDLGMVIPKSTKDIQRIKPTVDFILESVSNPPHGEYKKLKYVDARLCESDSSLENLLKYWSNKKRNHIFIEPRDIEFVYFKNTDRFVDGFFLDEDSVTSTLTELLENNLLGLGMFTYQDMDNTSSMNLDGLAFNILDKIQTNRLDGPMRHWWGLKNATDFYLKLRFYVDSYFSTLSPKEKKGVMSALSTISIGVWFDFESSNIFPNINDIFRIALSEFLCTPHYLDDMLYSRVWNVRHYLFKDMHPSPFSKIRGRNFKSFPMFSKYKSTLQLLDSGKFKNTTAAHAKKEILEFVEKKELSTKKIDYDYNNLLFLNHYLSIFNLLVTKKYFISTATGDFKFVFDKFYHKKKIQTWSFINFYAFKVSKIPEPLQLKKTNSYTSFFFTEVLDFLVLNLQQLTIFINGNFTENISQFTAFDVIVKFYDNFFYKILNFFDFFFLFSSNSVSFFVYTLFLIFDTIFFYLRFFMFLLVFFFKYNCDRIWYLSLANINWQPNWHNNHIYTSLLCEFFLFFSEFFGKFGSFYYASWTFFFFDILSFLKCFFFLNILNTFSYDWLSSKTGLNFTSYVKSFFNSSFYIFQNFEVFLRTVFSIKSLLIGSPPAMFFFKTNDFFFIFLIFFNFFFYTLDYLFCNFDILFLHTPYIYFYFLAYIFDELFLLKWTVFVIELYKNSGFSELFILLNGKFRFFFFKNIESLFDCIVKTVISFSFFYKFDSFFYFFDIFFYFLVFFKKFYFIFYSNFLCCFLFLFSFEFLFYIPTVTFCSQRSTMPHNLLVSNSYKVLKYTHSVDRYSLATPNQNYMVLEKCKNVSSSYYLYDRLTGLDFFNLNLFLKKISKNKITNLGRCCLPYGVINRLKTGKLLPAPHLHRFEFFLYFKDFSSFVKSVSFFNANTYHPTKILNSTFILRKSNFIFFLDFLQYGGKFGNSIFLNRYFYKKHKISVPNYKNFWSNHNLKKTSPFVKNFTNTSILKKKFVNFTDWFYFIKSNISVFLLHYNKKIFDSVRLDFSRFYSFFFEKEYDSWLVSSLNFKHWFFKNNHYQSTVNFYRWASSTSTDNFKIALVDFVKNNPTNSEYVNEVTGLRLDFIFGRKFNIYSNSNFFNNINYSDFSDLRKKKSIETKNYLSFFGKNLSSTDDHFGVKFGNSFVYKKKKEPKAFSFKWGRSLYFNKLRKNFKKSIFNTFDYFNNREVDEDEYFGNLYNHYFSSNSYKFKSMDNFSSKYYKNKNVEIVLDKKIIKYTSDTNFTNNTLVGIHNVFFFVNYWLASLLLFLYDFFKLNYFNMVWKFEFIIFLFSIRDAYLNVYSSCRPYRNDLFFLKKNTKFGLVLFDFFFYRKFVYFLVWLDPIIMHTFFFKKFENSLSTCSFYLLERHGFFFNYWVFFKENYFNWQETNFFDLVRFFINLESFYFLVFYYILVLLSKFFYLIFFTYYILYFYAKWFFYIIDFSIILELNCYDGILRTGRTAPFVNSYYFGGLGDLVDKGVFGLSRWGFALDSSTSENRLPITHYLESRYVSKTKLFEIADTLPLLKFYFLNFKVTSLQTVNIVYFLFFYFDSYFDYLGIDFLYIIDYIFLELNNYHRIGNIINVLNLLEIGSEFFDYTFIFLVLNIENYFEFFGQFIWLDICIFFDFLFERAVEFDFLTDINPASDSIFIILEGIRSLFSGNIMDNLPMFFFNFFDNEIYDDNDDEDFHMTSNNDDDFGDDTSLGLSNIDDMDSFEFLGWGSNVSIGTDPGNEFSTINDILDFPAEVEKFLLTDVSDFYNSIFGLDAPKLGSLSPSFDITLPVNSLWVVEVLYYNPRFGGVLFVNFEALLDFLKIIYLDRRVSFFSKIYDIADFSVFNYREAWLVFFKLKINYFFIDILQILDSVYFNPSDILYFFYFYIIFIFSYFGPWLPVAMYIFLIYLAKVNKFFERSGRLFSFNSSSSLVIFSQSFNYFVFRYVYFFLSNTFIFVKMSAAVLVFLSIAYLFTEGFHIFSILRLYSHDQESLMFVNSLFFNLERDPFVEKHVPIDEVFDQFKYDSFIDDDWSRTHYARETTEVIGGDLETPSVLDFIGFSKKHSFIHFLDEQDSEFNSSVSQLTRAVPQQIHNRVPDESSFNPRFVKDTVLEREFFRESELYGPEIEGSLDWHSRSKNVIDTLEDNWRFTSWFTEQHIVESDNFAQWNWGFSRDNEDYYNDLYDALLLNIADPKWLYSNSNILSIYDQKPKVFGHSGAQLFDYKFLDSDRSMLRAYSANTALGSLFDRNLGLTDQSPILDYFDDDPLSDLSIDNYNMLGSSIGTVSNSKSVYDDASSDIITQKTKQSYDRLVNLPIYFNFVENSNQSEVDYQKPDEFILENFFETIFNTKLPGSAPSTKYSTITESHHNQFNRKRIPNFNNFDNFHKKMGKNWILENNLKVKKFVTDGIPEGYFNMTSYVFKDLSNYNKDITAPDNIQHVSLENTRRRDLKFKKLEGSTPTHVHYDAISNYSIDKLLYYNFDSIYGFVNNYTRHFNNNEYSIKFDLNEPNPYWTGRKFPRTRWKWHKRYGYRSPYQHFLEEDRDDFDDTDVFSYSKSLGLDSTASDLLTSTGSYYDTSVKKKKPYNRKIISEFEKFLQPIKTSYRVNTKKNKGNLQSIFYKSLVSSNASTDDYKLDNGLSLWVGSGFSSELPLDGKKSDFFKKIRKLSGQWSHFYNKIKNSQDWVYSKSVRGLPIYETATPLESEATPTDSPFDTGSQLIDVLVYRRNSNKYPKPAVYGFENSIRGFFKKYLELKVSEGLAVENLPKLPTVEVLGDSEKFVKLEVHNTLLGDATLDFTDDKLLQDSKKFAELSTYRRLSRGNLPNPAASEVVARYEKYTKFVEPSNTDTENSPDFNTSKLTNSGKEYANYDPILEKTTQYRKLKWVWDVVKKDKEMVKGGDDYFGASSSSIDQSFVNFFFKKKNFYVSGNYKIKNKEPGEPRLFNRVGSFVSLPKLESTNGVYRKKIQEYLLSSYQDPITDEYGLEDQSSVEFNLKRKIFLNDNWQVNNERRPIYNIPVVSKNEDFVENLSEIRDSSLIADDDIESLLKTSWSSRDSRKFEDVRGFNSFGTEWPLSYRMHSLILPKYSENPIFVSDEFANSEQMWINNPTFAKRLNDLEVWGDGFIRELEYFREYNLNPIEHGRFYSTPNWDEDEDKLPAKSGNYLLQQKFNNWRHHKKESILLGTTESSLDFEDLLLNSGYAGNFKISGGDSHKDLFSTNLGNKLYDVLDTDYFQNKLDWYRPSFFFKKKTPWGFDFNTKMRWFGSQHWSLQKNLGNFSELFGNNNYKVLDLDLPDVDTFSREFLKFKSKSDLFRFLSSDVKNTYEKKKEWLDFDPYLKNYNNWSFNNYEKMGSYDKLNNIDFDEPTEVAISKVGKNRSLPFSDVDLRMNKELKKYSFLIMPENYSSTVDRDFNSELKHEWRTKFFQYGKMFRSLEQGTILDDYYSKYIPLYNRALTPRQVSDYFWMLYSVRKGGKYNNFFNKYDTSDLGSTTNSKLVLPDWDSKLRNPNGLEGLEIFSDSFGFNDNYSDFPNLGGSWMSSRLLKKMSQTRTNFSINQIESYGNPDLSFENINSNLPEKKKNISISSAQANTQYATDSIAKDINAFDIKSWKKLLNVLERGNFSYVNKLNWWFAEQSKSKNKTVHGGRTGHVLDYLFNNYSKKKKYRNPLFDEVNASHRFLAIENLKRKNIKQFVPNSPHNKFKVQFSNNLNMLSALKEIYEIPYDAKSNTLDEITKNDQPFDYDYLESGANSSAVAEDLEENQKFLFESDAASSEMNKFSFFNSLGSIGTPDSLFGDDFSEQDDSLEQFNFSDFESSENSFFDLDFSTKLDNNPNSSRSDKEFFDEPDSNFDDYDNFYGKSISLLNNSSNSNSWVYKPEVFEYQKYENTGISNYYDSSIEGGEVLSDKKEITKNTNPLLWETGNEFKSLHVRDTDDSFEPFFKFDGNLEESANVVEYFYNKKKNTKISDGGSGFVLENIKIQEKDDSFEISPIGGGDVGTIFSRFDLSSSDFRLEQPEGQNLPHNFSLYKKNKTTPHHNNFRKINPTFTQNNLPVTLGFLSSPMFLGISSTVSSDNNSSNSGIGLESLDFYGDTLDTNFEVKKHKPTNRIKRPVRLLSASQYSDKSLDMFTTLKAAEGGGLEFSHASEYFKDSLASYPSISEKFTTYPQTGTFDLGLSGLGPQQYLGNGFIGENRLPQSSPLSDIMYLKKGYKVSPTFGSDRYKIGTSANINATEDILTKDSDIFSFGSSNFSKTFENKKIVKSSIKHYFKFRDNLGYVEKPVNNFFINNVTPDGGDPTNSYIVNKALPIVRNLGNNFQLKRESLKNVKNKSFSISDGFSSSVDEPESFNYEISSIFRNAKQTDWVGSKKMNLDGFKLYAQGESIYPLPVIRSLGVDSKLFSKISSLRLYGAGRLNDFLYKPKLKHLLKNQTNFYNYDTEDSIDDYGPDDDDFLLKFDDFDTYALTSSELRDSGQSKKNNSGYFFGDDFGRSQPFYNNGNLFNLDHEHSQESSVSFSTSQTTDHQLSDHDEYITLHDTDLDYLEGEEDDPDFWIDDEYSFDIKTSGNYGSVDLVERLFFNDTADGVSYDSAGKYLGSSTQDSDWLDLEILEDNEDIEDIFSKDFQSMFSTSGFIDKDSWLFSLYKKLNKINNSQNSTTWVNTEGGINQTDFFENSDKNEEFLKLENQDWVLGNIGDFSDISKSWETGNSYGSFDSRMSNFGGFLGTQSVGNIDQAQEELVLNFKSEDDFDEPFDSYNSELENLQDFLDTRFAGLSVPVDRLDQPLWYNDNIFGIGLMGNTADSLFGRKRKIDSTTSLFLNQNIKNSERFSSIYPVPQINLQNSEEISYLNRSDYVKSSDWFSENTQFSEISDYLYGSSSKYFNDYEDSESYILEKLNGGNLQQVQTLRVKLADYFLKNFKNNTFSLSGPVSYKNFFNNSNFGSHVVDKNFFSESSFFNIWNIYNLQNKNFNWINRDVLKTIDQVSVSEKKNSINFFYNLFLGSGNYAIKKNLLSTGKVFDKNSINNLSELVRRSQSAENAQFGRRKYKKLKKKYWGRLDILEKYIGNVKHSLEGLSLNLENKKYFGKPIQTMLAYKNIQNFKNTDFVDDVSTFDKNTVTYLTESQNNLEKNSHFLNIRNYFRNNTFVVKNVDNSIFTGNTLIKNTENLSKFAKLHESLPNYDSVASIDTSDFLNSELPIDSANYFLFKFNNSEKSSFGDDILRKEFISLDDNSDFDEEIDDVFSNYSKIRSNFSKFQIGKFSNSYIPTPVAATFLSKLPSLSAVGILEESPKYSNFFLNKSMSSLDSSDGGLPEIKFYNNTNSFSKLNIVEFFKKPTIVDQFTIYHKSLKRPGLDFSNQFERLPIAPFRQFSDFNTLEDRSLKFGIADHVFKNSPVTRRSFDLAIRKFGPDFRTNSTLSGYGQLAETTDFNLNSEEDSGLDGGLGYPVINEQNLYSYDFFTGVLPKFGGSSIFSNKFLGFIWRHGVLSDKKNEEIDQFSSNNSGFPIFGHFTSDSDNSVSNLEAHEVYRNRSVLNYGKLFSAFLKKKSFSEVSYNFEPNFSRYVQTWNSSVPRKFKNRDGFLNLENESYYEDPMYEHLFTQSYSEEEMFDHEDNSYAHAHSENFPSSILSSFELSTPKTWDSFSSENLSGPFFEKDVTARLSKNIDEKNIGPLGYEEGDSLYDNRLLNRGWFPEKIAWSFGMRGAAKVGSDQATLEILSDYGHSFAHRVENLGISPDLEALKSLDWAGKSNRVFNAIDDIVEGFGIEENIPFKPSKARQLFEWEDNLERPTYDFFDFDDFRFMEDDEDFLFSNWNDPEEFHRFKDDNFSTLPVTNYLAETNSWLDSNYFGNSDSANIPGVSVPLADSMLFDGLVSDFTSFSYEKFPQDPLSGLQQTSLPLVTNNLFSNSDYVDSEIPEFSNYVLTEPMNELWNTSDGLENQKRNTESHFNMLETFKPKDSFNFSPNPQSTIRFDTEWVVNGEGWLGNSGSNIPIVSPGNLPHSYVRPSFDIFTQPSGVQSFLVNDDLDTFGGEDSPYFSLTDYQRSRIVRGRDNDVSNFPINSSWNFISKLVPNSLNLSWSHRLGGRSHVDFEEGNQDFMLDTQNWSEFSETVSILSGEGFQFGNSLEDNPDFIVFDESAVNQRNLWWRSVESGGATADSRSELANALIFDRSEEYRDFLTSFDFKIFGKSWTNPQEVKLPLKSFNFYGDSQLNSFLAVENLTFQKKTDIFSEKTYGLLASSSANFEVFKDFYSISLRVFFFKMYTFSIYYIFNWYTLLNDKIFIYFYFIISFIYFKLDFILIIFKLIFYFISSNDVYCFYLFKVLVSFFKILISFFNFLFLFILKIQTFLILSSNGNYFLYFFKEYFINNFDFNLFLIYKKFIFNFIFYLFLFIVLFFILIII